MMYDLELDALVKRIKDKDYRRVLIQLPDGLKPRADEIVDTIENETEAKVLIWLGSCFGACDTPFGLDRIAVDLVVQWGHNRFRKKQGW